MAAASASSSYPETWAMRPASSGWINRCHRLRGRAVSADARRHLDDRIISEEGQRAVIAQIDHLDITSISDQGRHQINCSLGVVGAAPLL